MFEESEELTLPEKDLSLRLLLISLTLPGFNKMNLGVQFSCELELHTDMKKSFWTNDFKIPERHHKHFRVTTLQEICRLFEEVAHTFWTFFIDFGRNVDQLL